MNLSDSLQLGAVHGLLVCTCRTHISKALVHLWTSLIRGRNNVCIILIHYIPARNLYLPYRGITSFIWCLVERGIIGKARPVWGTILISYIKKMSGLKPPVTHRTPDTRWPQCPPSCRPEIRSNSSSRSPRPVWQLWNYLFLFWNKYSLSYIIKRLGSVLSGGRWRHYLVVCGMG